MLDKVRNSLQNIKYNWENFSRDQSIRKLLVFEQEIGIEFSEYKDEASFLETELTEYILKKYNIRKKDKYIDEYIKLREERIPNCHFISSIENKDLNFIDKKLLKFATELAEQIFSEFVISKKEQTHVTDKSKVRIIKFNK